MHDSEHSRFSPPLPATEILCAGENEDIRIKQKYMHGSKSRLSAVKCGSKTGISYPYLSPRNAGWKKRGACPYLSVTGNAVRKIKLPIIFGSPWNVVRRPKLLTLYTWP